MKHLVLRMKDSEYQELQTLFEELDVLKKGQRSLKQTYKGETSAHRRMESLVRDAFKYGFSPFSKEGDARCTHREFGTLLQLAQRSCEKPKGPRPFAEWFEDLQKAAEEALQRGALWVARGFGNDSLDALYDEVFPPLPLPPPKDPIESIPEDISIGD